MKCHLFLTLLLLPLIAIAEPVVIGSKIFTESYLLSEIAAQTLEAHTSLKVDRRFGLGNSGLLVEALRSGKIDLYSDYSGTLVETIIKKSNIRTIPEIRQELEPLGFVISDSLGFVDTYALAVRSSFAKKFNLHTISDLAKMSDPIRAAFSYEFMQRKDGFPNLINRYKLHLENALQMEHSLVYKAIAEDAVDVIEVYSTDANVEKFNLVLLEDDLKIFPEYAAVWISRANFVKKHLDKWGHLTALEGKISVERMRKMNAAVELKKESVSQTAAAFLNRPVQESDTIANQILHRTKEHFSLVLIALLFSIFIGIPLGILASKFDYIGQLILIFAAVVQTIPTLALLCFLIPILGIGLKPAIASLCLYSLLPVVLNTFTGIKSVEAKHIENAKAFGLTSGEILFKIMLPLSSSMILTGLKTATIVTIGTGTLAALIGAGGYGSLIISGLSLNDMNIILAGAIPAALMALIAHLLFEMIMRFLIPRGWRAQ